MKFLKFNDGGDIIYLIAYLVYKFEPQDDGEISIYTDSPDNSAHSIYYCSAEELIKHIYANDEFEIIDCIRPDGPKVVASKK